MLQPILQNTMKEVNFFLRKFDLKAEECFFIDDLEPNIYAAKEAGMGGLVFTGDINEVKKAIGF